MTAQSQMLVEVADLNIVFENGPKVVHAVKDVSFSMGREKLAVVGESGSGKSMLARALLGLTPATARVSASRLAFNGLDLLGMTPREIRSLRGRRIGMILQDPHQALNPVRCVGDQIAEMIRLTQGASRKAASARSVELLAEVQIERPAQIARYFPHQISGGMGQRVMIAMALAGEPELLIADEATSALDAVVRHHILDLLNQQVERRSMGLILISHDLDLVARHADRVLVMYAGRLVETIAAKDLDKARHDYTKGLLACQPKLSTIGLDLPTLKRDPAWMT